MGVEVDAAAYMTELHNEVQGLRAELAEVQQNKQQVIEKDLLTYIKSIPDSEPEKMIEDMSPEVMEAMKTLVEIYVAEIFGNREFKGPNQPLARLVNLISSVYMVNRNLVRQNGLQVTQLCLWQLA